jgi:hypothetical protein
VRERLRTCPTFTCPVCFSVCIPLLHVFLLSFFLSFSFDLFLDYRKKLMSRVFFGIIRQGNVARVSLETVSVLQFCGDWQ